MKYHDFVFQMRRLIGNTLLLHFYDNLQAEGLTVMLDYNVWCAYYS